MAAPSDTASMALFCDFENVALGVRDAQYEKFDIKPVLERLLAKGSIVVKKAYCDWDRYKAFKSAMHEANFELIEIPHVRQSGKNSADIRLVVDALDLCYTKSHVDTFVIISGDSDFSPLVSKLRENAKRVIGVGVKQSCSDLLIANCDEFIYYDDLVRDREGHRGGARRENRENVRRSPEEESKRHEKLEERKAKAIELAVATFADLIADRGDTERIWASVLKEVIKRRNPGFNESYFGFRSFGNLLEEAAHRGLIGFGRDEKSGAYVTRVQSRASQPEETSGAVATIEPMAEPKTETATEPQGAAPQNSRRRGGRRSRKETVERGVETVVVEAVPVVSPEAPAPEAVLPAASSEEAVSAKGRRRGARQPRKEKEESVALAPEVVVAPSAVTATPVVDAPKPRKPRSRKPKAATE
ncbi:NYN domain-containing protein [Dechloromonas sp. A34]|uniref:NYN domain-containing protein n=1 Tax=Dechloromonas sp. A34 TaxID=447588 RepID=UPI0022492428|nr:NYN domain-containing protein [Dechloromonas sp. A34]